MAESLSIFIYLLFNSVEVKVQVKLSVDNGN